jgi:hypothetical protein
MSVNEQYLVAARPQKAESRRGAIFVVPVWNGRGRRLSAATPNREERMAETFAAAANLARL